MIWILGHAPVSSCNEFIGCSNARWEKPSPLVSLVVCYSGLIASQVWRDIWCVREQSNQILQCPFSRNCSLMPMSHRRHGQDKTVLSCPWQFSVILNIFDTEQLQTGNWVETIQTVLSCRQFSSHRRHEQDKTLRQDSFVLSVSAVENRHKKIYKLSQLINFSFEL